MALPRMLQNTYCCRNKLRFMFTLTIAAAVFLFLCNIITQLFDIPSSSDGQLKDRPLMRHEILDSWKQEKVVDRNIGVIAPVPCKGAKCNKFMGVLGLDSKAAGAPTGVSQHCKHPLFLAENDTIAHAFSTLPPLKCQTKLTSKCGYSKGRIRVAPGWSCLLQEINREQDSGVKYKPLQVVSKSMTMPKKAKGDHFRLSCAKEERLTTFPDSKTKVAMFLALIISNRIDEYHVFTHIRKYPDEKPDPCVEGKCLPYNVLILGIGSLSQMSFRRLLPKTYDYFTNTMYGFNFTGYNVVGEGSSGALLPMLSGLDETKVPEARINKGGSHYVDKMELLWYSYDHHGYATLYAEDHPSTNTFNERFQGFELPPTAHYMRPFWLAVDSLNNSNSQHCLDNKPKHQYTLDYLLDFHSTYKRERRFAIAMLKEITETDVAHAQYLDEDLLKFMKNLAPYLSDTLIFLMSDHGVLPKQSLTSWQAKAEARMPLLSVYLPTSFIKGYSDLAKTMINNEDKLITAYDVHHTLKDIIDIPRLNNTDPRDDGRFGQSLFKPIPKDRTCKAAGVNIHWCACHTQFRVQEEEVDKEKVKEVLLTELNQLTASYRVSCRAYSQIKLLTLTRLVPNEQIQEFERKSGHQFSVRTLLDQNYYQVTFKVMTSDDATNKDDGDLYEVTFEHTDGGVLAMLSKSYKIVSDMVRLKSSPQRNCLVDRDILRYCSCTK